jgi:N-acetylglucosaminyl-diphospho-decaprenol L-rhamnosyltransferase
MNDFAVVIVTKDRPQKLEKAIASVLKIPEINEIIVIDNHSENPVELALSDKIKIIRNSKTEGISTNRNQGINATTAPYVIFLDDDAFIEHLPLAKIKSFFIENNTVGIIAPKVLYPDGRIQESIRSFPTVPSLIWRGLGIYKIYAPNWYLKYVNPSRTNTPTEIDWCIGACHIVRRSIFNTIGLFDEYFKLVYDDVDFCARVNRAGFKVVFWPDSSVTHEYTRSSSNLFSKAALVHAKSIVRFFFKHYSRK